MTPGTMQRILRWPVKRAQLARKVMPQTCRHTFSVTAVKKGVSLPGGQGLLGHNRLTMTESCPNHSPEDVIREFHAMC